MRKPPLLILLFLMTAHFAAAQVATDDHDCTLTIPEIALLDIEPNISTFTLSLDAPTEAGEPVTTSASSSNNSKWLNYSSAIAFGAAARSVSVQVTNGMVPGGLNLMISASPNSGSGAGSLGIPVGPVNVSNAAASLITGIGGAYTGDGSGNGHRLTYSLQITDHGQLDFDESVLLEITFTITD
ncbi:MAG TPA: hypothetical protein ENJ95_24470 [Bacteroidetes bacterium]|nr:hypothetical protein [Bacteroidota bacterium]